MTIVTDVRHTPLRCRSSLARMTALRHVLASKETRLHTKLYYFENGRSYSALIGSANLTEGGLTLNHEFSTLMHGCHGDAQHRRISEYLDQLDARHSHSTPHLRA